MDTKECQETLSQLERLGFTQAHTKAKELQEKKRKLALAYEHYRFVRQENVDQFNQKLKEKTIKRGQWGGEEYQTLSFCPVSQWEKIPPPEVLQSMEEAVNHKCFDSFEVAYIRLVKDPLLFGRINGCSDRFFVAQWDNDITIDDLIMPNEG